MESTAESLLFWEQRIKERIDSGMTIEEWCKKNGLSRHKYKYWNQRIREKQNHDKEMTFAEITPVLSHNYAPMERSAMSSDFQIFFNNIQITVPCNFNQASLAGLMKVLRQL